MTQKKKIIGIVSVVAIIIVTAFFLFLYEKEKGIPKKDRYLAAPTPTITKIAPVVQEPVVTIKKSLKSKDAPKIKKKK